MSSSHSTFTDIHLGQVSAYRANMMSSVVCVSQRLLNSFTIFHENILKKEAKKKIIMNAVLQQRRQHNTQTQA